jgi:ABC-type polysaccharide/polyol phosphate export permease
MFVVGGLSLGQFALFLYAGLLIWIFFPLVFTPHGIVADKQNLLMSIRKSVNLTRLTLPKTGLLIAIILILSQGLDILWRIPEEKTWLTVLGIIGHAFVATSLLAATFIYYRDADRWVQQVVQQLKLSSVS